MLVPIIKAIASFLFESAASGIVGQVAYDSLADLYQKQYGKSIVSLYIKAFAKSVDSWGGVLSKVIEQGGVIEIDHQKLQSFFENESLEISSLSTLTESSLTEKLAKRIESVLILP